MPQPLYAINSRGEKRLFSLNKVYWSAKRAGASSTLSKEITRTIRKEVFSGINTSDIFKRIKQLLLKKDNSSAIRFSLKSAMRKLGPTGFPFEQYIGEILKKLGFYVKTNQYLPGFCLTSHETDFIAQKGSLIYVGECKYRNLAGEMIHLKDVLANFARFTDILNGPFFKSKKYQNFKIKSIIINNKKFTNRAKKYSECMKVNLLGWKLPRNRGLEYLIEKHKLYPVTLLPSLKKYLTDIFVSEKMMLVSDILSINPQKFSRKFKIPEKFLNSLIKEAKTLLKN